jgi:ectoine hydroxylase-related dioxygenase (phytanoyl-CoA dioxygenase family)
MKGTTMCAMSAISVTPLQPPAVPRPADCAGAAADRREPRDFTLAAADVRRFGEDGYLVVPALCAAAEQDQIRSVLNKLFARRAGRDEGHQFDMLSPDHNEHAPLQPQILKPSLYAPALLHSAYFQRVQAIARQLLGPDAEFNFDHSILKPAGRLATTPWHQDEAHRHDPLFHSEQISFWMPLQDVSEHNGCMRYIPGSQLGPLLPHRPAGNDPQVHALECAESHFDASRARPQPVAAGWCILHGGRTLHSALPNHSDADRLVYIVSFRGPPLARSMPLLPDWLAVQRTAASARHLHWLRHGGFAVIALRWLRALLPGSPRTLPQRIRHWLRRRLR